MRQLHRKLNVDLIVSSRALITPRQMTKNYRLKQVLFVDKSSCLYFKYRVCIWHWISYLGLKECNAMLRDHARFSRSRLALCVNTDRAPI